MTRLLSSTEWKSFEDSSRGAKYIEAPHFFGPVPSKCFFDIQWYYSHKGEMHWYVIAWVKTSYSEDEYRKSFKETHIKDVLNSLELLFRKHSSMRQGNITGKEFVQREVIPYIIDQNEYEILTRFGIDKIFKKLMAYLRMPLEKKEPFFKAAPGGWKD